MAIVLKNCYYLATLDKGKEFCGADVVIDGERISKIGKDVGSSVTNPERVIDCSRHVVVPGFVNTHHHFYQTLTRNLKAVQDAKLFDWLIYLYDIWKHLDRDAIYWSSMLAIGELLKTGCTTATDHHYVYPANFQGDIMETQFEAAARLGMRFSPTRGSMSRSKKDGGLPPDSVVQSEDAILADCERVLTKYHDTSDFSMRKIVLAPCSPFSVTKELMRDSAKLARKHGAYLHTHLAETEDENNFCVEIYKKRPLALMEECEFIGHDVFYAHGIHFNDDELKLLAKTDAKVAHCPSSNMRLGSGIARVKEMLAQGVTVGIAVDGSASNDSSDYLNEMRNALLLQRVRYGSDALTARQVFEMASQHGARVLGFQKIGTLAEGFAADIACFDVHRLDYAGSHSDPLAALLFCGYQHTTDYTLVNGKVVVDKGRLVGIDEDALFRKGHETSGAMIKRAAGK
jgi:cytosine/adenosine deaminase-related metal-dependent hydrolase